MMRGRARKVTISAVMTAMAVTFLFLANILPSGRLGIVAASSLFVTAAVIEAGIGAGVFVFVGSGILAAVILPDKTAVLLFALFFGYYPLIKSLSERLKKKFLTWALKVVLFNGALTIVWLVFRQLLFDADTVTMNTLIIYALGNLVFVLFDIGLTRLISLYIARISKNIEKGERNKHSR